MPYSVLIVDDEPSAIRYMKSLIARYLPEFETAGEAFSGLEALESLRGRMVDLLLTDARMPGMDGIELAREARLLSGGLKIVVISGHADFEYAKGALSAGVNEYLLKPLNIDRTVEVLRDVRAKLDREYAAARVALLNQLALGQPVAAAEMSRYAPAFDCEVALVRHGNLPMPRVAPEMGKLPEAEALVALPGRDAAEWIAIRLDGGAMGEELAALAEAYRPGEPATIARCGAPRPVARLRETVEDLARAIDERLVMGKPQRIRLPLAGAPGQAAIAPNELRKLEFFVSSGCVEALKQQLADWALDWEAKALPQRVVQGMVQQIVERALAGLPQAQSRRADVLREVQELFAYARGAGELMSGLWDVLFSALPAEKSRQPQADQLICEICEYLKGHCAEPTTMQQVCVRFGVSQTYLSRLFRKHKNTSFNDYLTDCRMDMARRLIVEQPGVKLRDVAALCGYEDPSYFSKVFRQREGMTPQRFAALHGAPPD